MHTLHRLQGFPSGPLIEGSKNSSISQLLSLIDGLASVIDSELELGLGDRTTFERFVLVPVLFNVTMCYEI